jgi:D-beta-D-heptose 7-phosphate kinase/D-beta-D-heptose 1-phosphate adenosyltransferase
VLIVERRPVGPAALVRRFRGLRALILGDALLDLYYEGTANRICREAPIPVVARRNEVTVPGGAANTAANLAAMGAEAAFLALVGADLPARQLREALRAAGVDDSMLIEDPSLSTLQKLRIVADGQYMVRFDSGDTSHAGPVTQRRLREALDRELARCDVVVVSDYSYGAVTPEIRCRLRALDVPVVVDAKDLRLYASVRPTLVTPNRAEAQAIVAAAGEQWDGLDDLASRTRMVSGAQYAAVTLAGDGVLLAGADGTVHVPAHRVEQAHDIGAGDSFTSAAALALAIGADPADAVRIAVEAACIAVTQRRTAVVRYQDLVQRVSVSCAGQSADVNDLCTVLEEHRRQGRTIVFTNGVFDILHAGHVQFLRQAASLGDVLVVGINSDQSARRLKGPDRPINGERDRRTLVAALDSVDHTVIFDADTPDGLIRALRPHVHVKGGDYASQPVPESATVEEVGGRTVILPLYQSESTTRVIERIVARSGPQ